MSQNPRRTISRISESWAPRSIATSTARLMSSRKSVATAAMRPASLQIGTAHHVRS